MTTQVSQYQKGKTNLDFTEARDGEWQWHQLGRVQVCTSLQADNHASTPPLSFYRPDALPATQPAVSKLKAVVAYCYCVSNFFVSKVTCNFIFNSYFWVYSVEIFYVVGMNLFFLTLLRCELCRYDIIVVSDGHLWSVSESVGSFTAADAHRAGEIEYDWTWRVYSVICHREETQCKLIFIFTVFTDRVSEKGNKITRPLVYVSICFHSNFWIKWPLTLISLFMY